MQISYLSLGWIVKHLAHWLRLYALFIKVWTELYWGNEGSRLNENSRCQEIANQRGQKWKTKYAWMLRNVTSLSRKRVIPVVFREHVMRGLNPGSLIQSILFILFILSPQPQGHNFSKRFFFLNRDQNVSCLNLRFNCLSRKAGMTYRYKYKICSPLLCKLLQYNVVRVSGALVVLKKGQN